MKAAILGVLLLVAIVYWMSLVWSWIKPEPEQVAASARPAQFPSAAAVKPVLPQPAIASPGPAANATQASQASRTSEANKPAWSEIVEWIQNDPQMIAAVVPPGREHPFDAIGPPPPTAAEIKKDEELKKAAIAAAVAEAEFDPAKLGLAVSSTILGSRGKAALVNGRTYRLGEAIRVAYEGQPTELRLTEVYSDRIVLEREGKRYEFHLPVPESSDRLEVKVMVEDGI